MLGIPSVREADVAGKRVLVRADFDVPLDSARGEPQVADDTRIRDVIPALEHLHAQGASEIVLIAHLGRPGGKVVESLRMAPVEARLRELTQVPCTLRENLRFDPREERNDPALARELATLGDMYVNEAFADSHREHASIVGVPALVPSYGGLRFVEEVERLSQALTPPPGSIAILGGAKLETKLPLIAALATSYSKVLVGGAIANQLTAPPASNVELPVDGVRDATHVADIGPETIKVWTHEVTTATFVLWNGPLGMYEGAYAAGTDAVAQALAHSRTAAVIGGGDTIAALRKFTFDPAKVFFSTGGGAMLHFLTHGTLPGIEALKQSTK